MATRTPAPSEKRVQRVLTDYGSVLLDESQGQYFHLNSTGTRIFEILSDEGLSERDAAQSMVDEYHIAIEQAQEDVSRLSAQLRERGLL